MARPGSDNDEKLEKSTVESSYKAFAAASSSLSTLANLNTRMISGSKLLFLLVVCVVVQTIAAWPAFNPFKQKNLERDIDRTITKLEKDTAKDANNARNKIEKEAKKALKKAQMIPEGSDCVMQQQSTSMSELEEAAGSATECLESVRSDSKFDPEEVEVMQEYLILRNRVRSQAKECRNESKDAYKKVLDDFKAGTKACLHP